MMTAEMTDFSRNWLRDSKSEKVNKLFEKRREKCQKCPERCYNKS